MTARHRGMVTITFALAIGGLIAACSPDTGAGTAAVCAPITVGGGSEPNGPSGVSGGAPIGAYSPPIGSYSPPTAYADAQILRRTSDNTAIAIVGNARFCVRTANDLDAWLATSERPVLDVNDVTFDFYVKNTINGDVRSQ